MFNLQRAKKSPTIFPRLTDVTPQAFEELTTVLKKPILNLKGKGCQGGKGKEK